ncbi:hypothetical protein EVAR_44401_1 [Eumeta japonica]|uniref:Uncharacterized protein n=1 Tax=Eumeta variegata TaxID=151549 RepID=A0A4C1XPA4_EUMVA|nr:hypothetical protein EVAR_44401_1 [Eumeta japonica]
MWRLADVNTLINYALCRSKLLSDLNPKVIALRSTVSRQNGCGSESESESRGLRTSLSAPASGLHALGEPAAPPAARLPRAQNPTVTLLQKAREASPMHAVVLTRNRTSNKGESNSPELLRMNEISKPSPELSLTRRNLTAKVATTYSCSKGQLSKGANHTLESDSARLPRDRATPPRGDPVHALRREYASESEAERREHERAGSRRMQANSQQKVEVGPTTRDGMPVSLRSVRDANCLVVFFDTNGKLLKRPLRSRDIKRHKLVDITIPVAN